jgi:hypothetical protein
VSGHHALNEFPGPGVYDAAITESVIRVCDLTTPENVHMPASAEPIPAENRIFEALMWTA